MYMRIKEVMNKYKVTRKALLLYEERGLIQPDRELSGYRDYRLVDIEVLKKIILLRKMEFSLDEIENIIIYNNKELILNKKNEYEKEAHFIETKKLYLDYIHDVIIGEYEIDETIDAIDDIFSYYGNCGNYYEFEKCKKVLFILACQKNCRSIVNSKWLAWYYYLYV